VAFRVTLSGEKVPVPLVDHTPPPAFDMDPLSWTPDESAQTLRSEPASAVGAALKLTTML